MPAIEMDYDALREKYRPDRVRLMFIAEAPPAIKTGEPPRFFYDVDTRTRDYLYLETMSVLFFGCRGLNGELSRPLLDELRNGKQKYLSRFKQQGFWLQDAVPHPLPGGISKSKMIRANIPRICEIVVTHRPETCILISRPVYENMAADLRRVGANILNARLVPFPACSHEREFRREMHDLLAANRFLSMERVAPP